MPVEILGNAYEQFLGKIIRITPARSVKIDEKPEVRKAGGVYYTPQYIVNYIEKNTVGKLVEGKTPNQISELKIVDPACGSGSFLLGAFEYLLNYHTQWYHQNPTAIRKSGEVLTPQGTLTTKEKKRILLNNIYGVDIDANAVEVTKLSLLLKCMEGETEASIQQQLSMFHERVLPDLDNNIKDGNSLIDADFYDNQIDYGFERKIKPFSWQKGFPQVFKQGGFDAVIGNPPYVMLQTLETKEAFNYTSKKFRTATYKIDTYQLFTEIGIVLLRKEGMLGYITPNTFLKNIHSEPLRRLLLENSIKEILLFNYSVFASASVDTCVLLVKKFTDPENLVLIKSANELFNPIPKAQVKQSSFELNKRADFNTSILGSDARIIGSINNKSVPLGTYCDAYFGIQTFDRDQFVSDTKKNENYRPVIDGANINPYSLSESIEFVNFIPKAIKSGGEENVYKQDRICIRQIGAVPIATFVPANIFTLNTIYNVYLKKDVNYNLFFLLGIINSKALKFYWKKNNSDEKKTFPKIKKEAILSIPIPVIESEREEEIQSEVEKNVVLLLRLNDDLQAEKLPTKIKQIKTRISYSEERIDQLVYELYQLTPEEIKMVEAATHE
jgi:hypothetical protein